MKVFYTAVSALVVAFMAGTAMVDANPIPMSQQSTDFATIRSARDAGNSIQGLINQLYAIIDRINSAHVNEVSGDVANLGKISGQLQNTKNSINDKLSKIIKKYESAESHKGGWGRR
ncbi:hypothetical protein BDF19DRAFT_439877 [Syncephalis fuscata]|nr:hypothetical protein BDF19DRAFT_439877 [Syncephalis fuscata]